MYLRNFLLVISFFMVGFCITLYFQADETVQSMNFDQYKSLNYNEERSHSLEDLNKEISPHKLERIIKEIFERNQMAREKTRVMEIGPGNGRILMSLKKIFPEVEFYGINKEKTHTFYRRESFIMTALKFELFTKLELDGIDLPYIVFQDLDFGNRIPYEENKFDLIYSQDTVPYVKYKFELFNEIMRVLKPSGVSIHTDVTAVNIYGKGLIMSLWDAMAEMRKRGIDVSVLENRESIRFRKSKANALFPVTPHQPIPEDVETIPLELKKPQMSYNLNY
ncbi:MAG TPA: methyltransferase domain-containing protein [Bacteriovoracaceae bacterium]|nr:methyltransferase domain-containing protein [Bacteriovoracaceae bacterium]